VVYLEEMECLWKEYNPKAKR